MDLFVKNYTKYVCVLFLIRKCKHPKLDSVFLTNQIVFRGVLHYSCLYFTQNKYNAIQVDTKRDEFLQMVASCESSLFYEKAFTMQNEDTT